MVRNLLQRPRWRIGLGFAAAVVVALLAATLYIFRGPSSSGAAPVTATLRPTKTGTIFTIDPSSTQASFTMHEVLFGQPNTVVGTTHQVAGQILVDTATPAQSKLGQIRVDVSTLATDNSLRNRALQNYILETNQPSSQYATFLARSLSGLPAKLVVGQTVSFHITGDLTIHQVTRTVTFDTQLTLVSPTTVKGQAQTTVSYADFNISIPNVPSVTGVSNDVQLALTFTAQA